MIKKIKSKSGETLVEMLVSITILVLALSILSAMLAAAYNSENAAREADKSFYEELSAAETQDYGTAYIGPATVKITDAAGKEVSIENIKLYGKKEGGLRSYKKP